MQRLIKTKQQLLPWLLAVLILITIGGNLPAVAQEASAPRILAVTGHGHEQAPATLAEITLGVSSRGDSAKKIYEQLDQRSAAVAKLLEAGKAEGIKTSNMNLNLKYDRDGKPKKTDYEGYRNIRFQVSADKIGVLDDAIATDIDRIHSISYRASEKDILVARNQALEKAITDAQAQAKVALDKLGFSIQEVVDIQVDDALIQAPGSEPVTKGDSYSSGRWVDNPVVENGEQSVDVKVTLKVRY